MNIQVLISHQKQEVHAIKRELDLPIEKRLDHKNDTRLKGELACAQGILRVLHRSAEFGNLISGAVHG